MDSFRLVYHAWKDTPKKHFWKSIFGDVEILNTEHSEFSSKLLTEKRCFILFRKLMIPKIPVHRPDFLPNWLGSLLFGDNSCYFHDETVLLERKRYNYKNYRILFVNGILMDITAVRHIQTVLRTIFHRNIDIFYNSSDSLIPDLFEAFLNKSTDLFTEASWKLFLCILSMLFDPTIHKLIIIGHSQGTILLSSILQKLKEIGIEKNKSYLQKIEFYLFSNCASSTKYIDKKRRLPYIENISNENDFVSRLGQLSNRKDCIDIDGKEIILNDCSGHLFGANYLSGSFKEKYKKSRLVKYIN